jgi:hypothetical protein
MLMRAGSDSLALSVELFNRPVEVARAHAVLLLLGHSFEMLLKAVIYQRRGRIRDRGEPYTYEFKKVINICRSDLGVIDEDDLAILRAIQQDRNAAAHETVAMSEDMLWLHVRSAVTIYKRILREQFEQDLAKVIPARAVPVSALPPTDALAVVATEMDELRGLLVPGTRRGDEARARIRPLLALDGSVTGREEPPAELEINRAAAAIRAGRPWQSVFPGLAQLTISDTASPGSLEVTLRVARSGNGIPVRRAKPEEAESALVYRTSDPFQEFNIRLSKFGEMLGLTQYQGYALTHYLKLKDDDRAYFVKRNSSGNVIYQGLSARSLHLAREVLSDPTFDMKEVVDAYRDRKGARDGNRITERSAAS